MPLTLIRNDITKMTVDAVVSPCNSQLRPDGGVSAQIFEAAGREALDAACAHLRPMVPGTVGLTRGFRLGAAYVIHTVGPIWQGGNSREAETLSRCYRGALELAAKHRLSSIAIPLISAGSYSYPVEEALAVATAAIRTFLEGTDLDVYLVLFSHEAAQVGKRFARLRSYIDDHYCEERATRYRGRTVLYESMPQMAPCRASVPMSQPKKRSLAELLGQLEESFSQMLLRLIDEKGMTDVEVYKRANLDRKLFSKLRKNTYNPSKPTALALCIALRLNLDEAKDLLAKAGYALSGSSKADVIITYFIQEGCYDIFEINEALFAFDQKPLGA